MNHHFSEFFPSQVKDYHDYLKCILNVTECSSESRVRTSLAVVSSAVHGNSAWQSRVS